jgi:hypothetical protein
MKEWHDLTAEVSKLALLGTDENGMAYISAFVHHQLDGDAGERLRQALEDAVVAAVKAFVA